MARADSLTNDMGVSMSYLRRDVNGKTACRLGADWQRWLDHVWDAMPEQVFADHLPVAPEHEWTILCWWCRGYHLASEVEKCMSLPRKIAPASSCGESSSNALAAGLLTAFPEIWAFLTSRNYPDGSKRRTGRLSLHCGLDGMVLSATDEETGLYTTLVAKSLDDALLELETGMAADSVHWRVSRFGRAKK